MQIPRWTAAGILEKLWLGLDLPSALHEDESRREYMTRVILTMLVTALLLFTLLIAVGWGVGWFFWSDAVLMLGVSLLTWGGWWLAHHSAWRTGGGTCRLGCSLRWRCTLITRAGW